MSDYQPTEEALKLIAFIRAAGIEDNANAEIHYRLCDKFFGTDKEVLIESFRGSAKSTMMEWFIIYAAAIGEVPNFGRVEFIAFIGDSAENGVKNFFRNIAGKIDRSVFLQQFIKIKRKTDSELELVNADGKELNIKGYGMKALALDTKLHTECGTKTIGNCKVGDRIIGADGKPCTILHKSDVFNKPMYRLELKDGRSIKISNDHINSVIRKENYNNKATYKKYDMTTTEILECKLFHERQRQGYASKEPLFFIENCGAVEYTKKELSIDPYTLGLLLGDGSTSQSVRLHGHVDDMEVYKKYIPYKLGKEHIDTRNNNVVSYGVLGLQQKVKELGINVHGDNKFVPKEYFKGSKEQRLELLTGLMDTDGTISRNGRTTFCSNSEQLVLDVMELCRSLGGKATITRNREAYLTELWLNKPMFKLPRKLERQVFDKDTKVAITAIVPIPAEKSQCIAVDNEEHQFIVEDYVRTHNTNIRGVRYKGVRPDIVVMDDVTTNESLTSETIQNTINDNFYKAVIPALHPTRYRIFVIGTPISERDILHQLANNPSWTVHRFPICEKFPCTEEEFKGNWTDRFPYEAVKSKYDMYKASGKAQDFAQEYMLELLDLSDLLVDENDIKWFDPEVVIKQRRAYNFYISTDFATSTKKSADFSTIGVWAINNNNDWMLVDGQCRRQTMQQNIDDLFRYVQKWKPLSVGIESSGQQGGFISILEEMMVTRNTWFSFAKKPGSKDPGIRPVNDKVHRFVTGVQPKFKQGKVWLPRPEYTEKKSPKLNELVEELTGELSKFTMAGGVKSLKHDDALDLLNQLSEMETYAPSNDVVYEEKDTGLMIGSEIYWPDDTDSEFGSNGGSTMF